MKNLNKLMAIFFIASVFSFVAGCEGDTDDPTVNPLKVEVEVKGDAPTYLPGESIVYTITVTSSEKIDRVEVTPNNNGTDAATTTIDFGNEKGSLSKDYTYTIPAAAVAGTPISIKFVAYDKETQDQTTVNFTVTSEGSPIKTYSAVLMGAQAHATKGSYLNAATGEVMNAATAAANDADVDIIYYYGSSNKSSLVAPNDDAIDGDAGDEAQLAKNLDPKNATKIAVSTVTAEDFDAMDTDATISGLTPSGSMAKQLAVGSVVAFETVDGLKGLIKVTAVTEGTDGTIEVIVKVQDDTLQ